MTQVMSCSNVQNTSKPRPRADRSSVARYDVADLVSTTGELERKREREREKLHTARIGSRGIGARRVRSTRVVREQEAPPRQARRQRGTKPGQQRRPHSAERLCTATSKKEREDGIPHPAERLISQIQERGGRPRAMQERSVKNKTHNRSRPQCERHCETGDDAEREKVMSTREGK